jgi:acylphosphatase
MAEARRAVRLRIEGRVQGVGFRAFVEREAAARGLDGWVRNRRDGGVEAVIAGPPPAIETMIGRCRQGPASGRVDRVDVRDEPDDVAPGFGVHPTV